MAYRTYLRLSSLLVAFDPRNRAFRLQLSRNSVWFERLRSSWRSIRPICGNLFFPPLVVENALEYMMIFTWARINQPYATSLRFRCASPVLPPLGRLPLSTAEMQEDYPRSLGDLRALEAALDQLP